MPSPATSALVTTPPMASPHKSTWYPYSNSSHFDSNIALVLIILFCGLVCALALNLSIRCFLRPSSSASPRSEPDIEKPEPAPPVPQLILPTLVFSSGVKLAGAEAVCAICLSDFVHGEEVRVLPRCKHGYHVNCVQAWLSSHASCPTCRSNCLPLSPLQEAETNTTELDVESQSPPAPPSPLHIVES